MSAKESKAARKKTAELQKQQAALDLMARQRQAKRQRNTLHCILCGAFVPRGTLLEHKAKAHGEALHPQRSISFGSASPWVHVFQGGLPGLGKRGR